MRFKFDIKVPKHNLKFENEELVIKHATEHLREAVLARLRTGEGSRGRLPRAKDGSPPYKLSGQLINSVSGTVKKGRNGRYVGNVLPTGKRSDAESQRAAAKRRTRSVRQRWLASERNWEISTGGRSRYRSKKTGRIKTGHIGRSNAADRNMALAAILYNRPKDKRARNGDRQRYYVFEGNQAYHKLVLDILLKQSKIRLEEK